MPFAAAIQYATAAESQAGTVTTKALNPSTGRGRVIQRAETLSAARIAIAGTSIPYDNTIPQNTEGDEVLTLSFTPLSASSRLIVEVQLNIGQDGSNGSGVAAALFKDSGANAIASWASAVNAAGTHVYTANFQYQEDAGSTTARTFKVRVGSNSGTAALSINGQSGAARHGGVLQSFIRVREVN